MEHHTHELPIFINKNSNVLVLGSFPSVKSREYGFYYSHKQNRFFPVLAAIFNEETPSTKEEKMDFCNRHGVALYDVIEECDIDGSSDSSIRNEKPIDIETILKEYPNIKVIGITGKKASKLFDKYLKEKVRIQVMYLPSTSPANAKMGLFDLVKEYQRLFY